MFKKVLKVIGIVLAGLVGLAAVLVIALYALGNARLTRKYDVQAGATVRIQIAPAGAASGSPSAGASGQSGQRTLTAGDVLITNP